MRTILELEAINLTKRFGDKVALDGISFRFKGPGVIGYLGPNGAGKTTTLKIFSHLLRPTSGKALINGIDIQKDYVKALRSVAAVVETPEPFPDLGVRDFLTMVGGMRGLDGKEIERRISRLQKGLSLDDLDVRGKQLSKGNKQRAVLAAALIADAEILLLDEPTSGLDPAETRGLKDLIKKLKKTRLIFMSSHLLDEVIELCDKAVFINNGKIVLIDSVSNVTKKFGRGRKGAAGLEDAYMRLIKGI